MLGTPELATIARQLKYCELKAFRELLIGISQVACAFKAVENCRMIASAERISNFGEMRVEKFSGK
jgi:hypothetical protein